MTKRLIILAVMIVTFTTVGVYAKRALTPDPLAEWNLPIYEAECWRPAESCERAIWGAWNV